MWTLKQEKNNKVFIYKDACALMKKENIFPNFMLLNTEGGQKAGLCCISLWCIVSMPRLSEANKSQARRSDVEVR